MGDLANLKMLAESVLLLHSQDFTQKIEIFFIAWFFIRRTIAGHFKKIEDGLSNVAGEVSKLGESLSRVESNHSQRLNNLERWQSEVKGGKSAASNS